MKVLIVAPELPRPGKPNTLAPLARQIQSLRDIGLDVDVLEVRGIRRLKYLQTLPRLWSIVRQYDLIHAHYTFCGWLARAQFSRPLVVSFMGTDLMGVTKSDGSMVWRSRVVTRLTKLFARHVDAVIVKSEDMVQRLGGLPAFVIPNGVDTERFMPQSQSEARARLGWPESELRVLFPGNPANVRKAFPLAQEAIACASKILSRPIETVILKDVEPELVPPIMNACDAMVLTSHHEGSPNVVKEAMCCNLPVASVDVGDVRWLLGGVEGYRVGRRDAQDLGSCLAELIQGGVAAAGNAKLVELGLDLKSVAKRVQEVYVEALNASREVQSQRKEARTEPQRRDVA